MLTTRTAITLAAVTLAATAQGQTLSIFEPMVDDSRFQARADSMPPYVPAANLDAVFFFKNNEYFAPQAEGYTLPGYLLRPTLTWGGPRLSLTGGLQALQYGGMSHARYVRLFASARWKATPWLAIQAGCLPGPASHMTHEAVTDPELQLTEKPELGLQLSVRRPRLKAEAWVNWRKFIFMGDSVPERFSAGVIATFTSNTASSAAFTLHASLLFEHIGGQISDYDEPMQSLANATLSPTLLLRGDSSRFLRSLAITAHILAFHTMAGSDVRPFTDGWAISPEARLTAKHLEASVAYFHAHDYFAMRGNPLFWSISNYDHDLYQPDRDLLCLSASFVAQMAPWGRFSLDLRAYHDIPDARLDYSYGLTMVLTPSRGH